MLRIQDVTDLGTLADTPIHLINAEQDQEYRRTRLREGDLVYSVVGSLGRCLEIGPDLEGANVSRAFCVIGIPDRRLRAWIKQYLTGPQVEDWLAATATGNAQRVLNMEALSNLQIPLPLDRQRDRIVEILEAWNASLLLTSNLISARRKALSLLRYRLVEAVQAPACDFGRFAVNTNRLLDAGKAAERNLKCIELEHLEEATGRILGRVDPSTLKGARRRFELGDVLFGRLRPYLRKFAQPGEAGVCSTEIWALAAQRNLCTPAYLYQIVQTDRFISEANKSFGSKMPRADWDVLSKVRFPIPPMEQQTRVAALLAAEEDAINILVQLEALFRSQRAQLMRRLLSGDLLAQEGAFARTRFAEAAHA